MSQNLKNIATLNLNKSNTKLSPRDIIEEKYIEINLFQQEIKCSNSLVKTLEVVAEVPTFELFICLLEKH